MADVMECYLGEITGLSVPAGAIKPSVSLRYIQWKRAIDFTLSVLIFILSLPLVILAITLVKLTSPGPAIYSQRRVGYRGRPFTIYKIRTMVRDSERLTGPLWAITGDSRITPVGRFLRATHLDEFPQLWNVLRGEMSLVGPRPERPEFVGKLELAIPIYRDRLLVRPGVTGLAQIQLPPDTDLNSVRRKQACDLYYVRRISPWLDLRILLSTVGTLVGIPFDVPRMLLRIPSGAVVEEEAYRDLSAEAVTTPMPSPPERARSLDVGHEFGH